MKTKSIEALAFLLGVMMIFIGIRFFIVPLAATTAYGLQLNVHGNYSFQYIKGIRDIFSGLVIAGLLLSKQKKALGLVLLTGSLIPMVDLSIVLSKDYNTYVQAIPHITAIVLCLFMGIWFLRVKGSGVKEATDEGRVRIIRSARSGNQSIIEFPIMPGDKTPTHYHTLFSETFTVLNGSLAVGRNGQSLILNTGETITINPHDKHYFENNSGEPCLIQVTIDPGNLAFEEALLISKGLAKDGLASTSGTPKRISDLALFIYLNNSRMVGMQKIAEPLFDYLAKSAIRKGRLKELESLYCPA